MKYLIDTDWLIDYLKGKTAAGQLLDRVVHQGIAISLITYGKFWKAFITVKTPKGRSVSFVPSYEQLQFFH